MIIFWFPLYLLLIIIFNTILLSSLSPCSIELHDLTISISGNKISSAISMFPSTLPLSSVFFLQLCLCCLKKLMFFLVYINIWMILSFFQRTQPSKDAFPVFYIGFPHINFAHLPSVRWWWVHQCHISHHIFTCKAILSNNHVNG